jgi:hypothetical protein
MPPPENDMWVSRVEASHHTRGVARDGGRPRF